MKIKKPIKKDHIPSLFTLLNMFLGFLSIISAIEGFYLRAAYLIIAASIFDGMDGKLARWIQAPSKFGSELDSLADLVSFSVAPAVLIWTIYTSDLPVIPGALIAGAPLFAGAIRLARFNVSQHSDPKPYFEGLPAPVGALVIISLILYYSPTSYTGADKLVLPMVIAVSFLMVSQIRYTKTPMLTLRAGLGNTLYLLGTVGTLFIALFIERRFLLPMVLIYLLSGIVRWLMRTDARVDFRSVEKKI